MPNLNKFNNELIIKISKKPYNASESWKNFIKDLEEYIKNEDLDLYRLNNISPPVFSWPENSIQNINQLKILEKDEESIFYKTIFQSNNYGPYGIKLYENIQLDRVAQTWSIYNLVNVLNMNLNDNEIIFEFGGGTGQMADVLSDLNFKGKHIVYDLPLITVLQRYFVNKRYVKNTHILDDEELNIINGTNYLPCNQINYEKYIMGLSNINFIATYSLSETDIHTHNKFYEYMIHFSRIYIVYWSGKQEIGDYIDNDEYIEMIKRKIENTHYCYIGDNYGNGKVFMAVKKELKKNGILPPVI